jgi:mono/diheme cytochrome c family protein
MDQKTVKTRKKHMSNIIGKWLHYRWLVYVLVGTGLLLLGTAFWVQAAPPGQSAEQGEIVFNEKCAGCHTVGGGDLAGPDLAGVAEIRERDWLERWLAEPDVMLAEGDPIATDLLERYSGIPMPNQNLSQMEIEALLAYMGAVEPSPSSADTEPAPLSGSASNGKDLFTGATQFANGGTACIACHDTADLGVLGGGMLGPDLTDAYERYGENGLVAVLGTISFPSMVPVYQDRPLTAQEQIDLTLFLKEAADKDAPSRGGRHFTMYVVAFATMDVFLGILFLWRRRSPQRRHRSLMDR